MFPCDQCKNKAGCRQWGDSDRRAMAITQVRRVDSRKEVRKDGRQQTGVNRLKLPGNSWY